MFFEEPWRVFFGTETYISLPHDPVVDLTAIFNDVDYNKTLTSQDITYEPYIEEPLNG